MEKDNSKYEITIIEVGKESADELVLSAEEFQQLLVAINEDDWFVVEVDGETRYYNTPFLSSIRTKKQK